MLMPPIPPIPPMPMAGKRRRRGKEKQRPIVVVVQEAGCLASSVEIRIGRSDQVAGKGLNCLIEG